MARGDAHPGSDTDLFADFDPGRLSLVGLASLRADVSNMFGASGDLVERRALHPAVLDAAERDAVRVL